MRDRSKKGGPSEMRAIIIRSVVRPLKSSGRALGNSFAVGWHMDCQSSQAVRRTCLMFLNQRLGQREPIEAKRANHLAHVESQFCWCDPVVEIDEYGQKIVVHIEVTWH